MTDREAFIAAIAATPAADLPRLVFADWLDEHDEPALAEFVRAHVRLYHLRPGTAEHAAVAERCDELMSANCGEWFRAACEGLGVPVPQFAPKGKAWWLLWGGSGKRSPAAGDAESVLRRHTNVYRISLSPYSPGPGRHTILTISRGMLERIELDTSHAHAEPRLIADVFLSNPAVDFTLDIQSMNFAWQMYDGPHLRRIKFLTLQHSQTSLMHEQYESVFESDYLVGVTALTLSSVPRVTSGTIVYTSSFAVRALSTSPLVGRLKVLRVRLAVDVLEALTELPKNLPLEELVLTTVDFTPEWPLLPAIPLRETLRRLSLKSCRLTDDAVLAITRVRRWDKLTHLRLDDNTLADRGVAGMCRTCVFPEVRFLNLARNRIGDAGAVAIARSGLAQTVRFLDLTDNPVTATGAVPLAAALAEGPLQLLKLSARPLGRRTARRVAEMLGNRVRFA